MYWCWKGSKTYSRKYEWPHAESQCNVWIRKRKTTSRSVKIVFRRVHFCPQQSSQVFPNISWNSNGRIWSLNLEPKINFFFQVILLKHFKNSKLPELNSLDTTLRADFISEHSLLNNLSNNKRNQHFEFSNWFLFLFTHLPCQFSGWPRLTFNWNYLNCKYCTSKDDCTIVKISL